MTDISVSDAQTAVLAHPLCADFVTTPQKFVVFYPDAYTIPGGCAVQRGSDDLSALQLLLRQLDDFWNVQTLQIAAGT